MINIDAVQHSQHVFVAVNNNPQVIVEATQAVNDARAGAVTTRQNAQHVIHNLAATAEQHVAAARTETQHVQQAANAYVTGAQQLVESQLAEAQRVLQEERNTAAEKQRVLQKERNIAAAKDASARDAI